MVIRVGASVCLAGAAWRDKVAPPVNEQVTVRVPASTSNLGPGFDCLGLALRLYNFVRVRRTNAARLPAMCRQAVDAFFAGSRQRPFAFECAISGEVPAARGLGSSVTVRLGVLCALNELSGRSLSRQQLFETCAELETHPDNAAPAAFGGFTVVRDSNVQRWPVLPKLHVVLLIPPFEIATKHARKLLPTSIPRRDAVMSAGNVAATVSAFAAKDYRCVRFEDGLHQPFRRRLVPFLDEVIVAAEKAGALGGFLSGSGSTICALTLENPDAVASAMSRACGVAGARTIVTRADNHGARIVSK